MTNAMIIEAAAFQLFQDGKINGSGHFATTIAGDRIELPEAIHTFQEWKRHGFSVKKGEHAVASFLIWKPCKTRAAGDQVDDPDADGENAGDVKMIKVKAHFFAAHQVQPIQA